jgi:hypothetical protein
MSAVGPFPAFFGCLQTPVFAFCNTGNQKEKRRTVMTELSILELETEQAELLPERETLFLNGVGGFGNHVTVHQTAVAFAGHGFVNTATAVNVSVIA